LPPIKLIVTDLDGTFTTSKYAYCPENAEAVRLAQQSGIAVCACTARNWGLAKGQVRRVGFDRYTIACNGASIVDNATGLPVYRETIDADDVEKLIEIGVRNDADVAVYTNEQILVLDGHASDHYVSYLGHWDTADRDLCIAVTRCQSVLEMAVRAQGHAELVEISKKGGVEFSENESAFMSRFSKTGIGGHCIHLMQKGITKLSGVTRLMEMLKIPRECVMTVGDNVNDVEMLRYAAIGVAVQNGDAAALAAADYVTSPHNEAGFHRAVMRHALGRSIVNAI
jgi:hypothetical protein